MMKFASAPWGLYPQQVRQNHLSYSASVNPHTEGLYALQVLCWSG